MFLSLNKYHYQIAFVSCIEHLLTFYVFFPIVYIPILSRKIRNMMGPT